MILLQMHENVILSVIDIQTNVYAIINFCNGVMKISHGQTTQTSKLSLFHMSAFCFGPVINCIILHIVLQIFIHSSELILSFPDL